MVQGKWLLNRGLTAAVCGFAVACGAGQTIRHEGPAEHLPHLTWEISAASSRGADSVLCSSQHRDRTCVLKASTSDTQQAAAVSLELHAASQSVSYTGTITSGFLVNPHSHEVTQTVAPEDRVKVIGLLDAVSSKPGDYTFNVEMSGLMGATQYPIRFSVPVTVQ
jgi:hypothetical protein